MEAVDRVATVLLSSADREELKAAIEQIDNGEYTEVRTKEELTAYLDSL